MQSKILYKFELRRPQATSKEVQDLFRRRDGENKEYTEYENDCIIMIYIYIYVYIHIACTVMS